MKATQVSQFKLLPAEPAPNGFASSVPSQEQLDEMKGMFLLDGQIQLLTAPAWSVEHKRWQALANVNGMLCVIQVGIKANGLPCIGEL